MAFTDDDFIDLLNFCRDENNFHESARKPFDHLYNISKSDGKHKTPLIADSRYWCYNLDSICINVHIANNGKSKNRPASVDALYFIKDLKTLYFMEFKGLSINSTDYKRELKSINIFLRKKQCEYPRKNCPLSEEIFNSLNTIKNRFSDEIICQLNIKTTESLFFTLPAIYRKYCENNEISYEKHLDDFISWLLKSKKKFIVVFKDKKEFSPSNRHLSFENRLRNKFNHFQNVSNSDAIIIEKSLFEKDFLHKYFDRVDFPAYTTVDYMDFLNKEYLFDYKDDS